MCLSIRGVSIKPREKGQHWDEERRSDDNGRFEEAPAGWMKTFLFLSWDTTPRKNPRHNGRKPMKARIVSGLLSHGQYAAFLYSCFVFYPVSIGSKPTTPSISVMLGGWMQRYLPTRTALLNCHILLGFLDVKWAHHAVFCPKEQRWNVISKEKTPQDPFFFGWWAKIWTSRDECNLNWGYFLIFVNTSVKFSRQVCVCFPGFHISLQKQALWSELTWS